MPRATDTPTASCIDIVGARVHNLKNVTAHVPLGRMTVITGVSGSGKSSLAFDTLYAEGQRRFVESMSTYARQFIEKMARPDVDEIRNIQPAIAIEQKNSVKNARSTIGTATEIADYLRLLFAKAGRTTCPDCDLTVREDTPQSVAESVLDQLAGCRLYIVAPVEHGTRVAAQSFRHELLRAGFSRVLAPQGTGKAANAEPARILDLNEAPAGDLDAVFKDDRVRVVVDRVVAEAGEYERIASSLALAFQASHETVEIHVAGVPEGRSGPTVAPGKVYAFHSGFRCNGCGRSFQRPEPNLFSFNSPLGACPDCTGFGRVVGVDWEKVIPDRALTLAQRPIATFNTPSYKSNYTWLRESAHALGVPWNKPVGKFTKREWKLFIHGDGNHEGLKAFFDWLEKEKYKVQSRILMARYRGFATCERCGGTRLVPDALAVRWQPADGSFPACTIADIARMCIRELLSRFIAVRLSSQEDALFGRIFREILSRLNYLVRVGLGYLTLDRQTRTLSGGEAQRINLATALGTALTQTLYVLDEPTVGLHPRDSRRLLEILWDLRSKGNTVVVVEHDPELILGADHVLDLGPRAGSHGGEIMFAGSPQELLANGTDSETTRCLRDRGNQVDRRAHQPTPRSRGAAAVGMGRELVIVGAREHNLKNLTVAVPLGKWVCVTGVSGSGKTTLVHKVLFQAFQQFRRQPVDEAGVCERVDGFEQLDEVLLVDQSPIGRSIRSNPVTYMKAYDPIRKLLAGTREARTAGFTESSFSFNVKGGRCETCEGTGVTTYDMHFLAEMTLPCEECNGRRFQPRVLEVRHRGRNIDDILGMTVDDATAFFAEHPSIGKRLAPLREVGLGYLTLGQSTATLSGGEAQRLKLAGHLTGGSDGRRTMMIFDEPTTGLHLADLAVLSAVFRKLVARGYSLLVIEHNLEIIRQADWIIDLGPEGGEEGGFVVAAGPPAVIASRTHSHTGRFLRELG